MTTGLAEVVMDQADARRLTERIRLIATTVADGVEKLKRLVIEAREGNAHLALGYRSWTEYLADVMGKEPLLLARDARRELVGVLADEGMSTRAIAPIVGVSKSQVSNDLDQLSSSGHLAESEDESADDVPDIDAPAPTERETAEQAEALEAEVRQQSTPVTGLDGKSYRKPVPQQKPRNRRPITDAAHDAGYELQQAVERIGRLLKDDRFNRNREEMALLLQGRLTNMIETCQGYLDHLTYTKESTP